MDELKRKCAISAVDEFVSSASVVGLGTGSTTAYAVERLAQRQDEGKLIDVTYVATSSATTELASGLGVEVTPFHDFSASDPSRRVDVTVDGCDEVDLETGSLVKGRGGALFREKMVALASERLCIICDESKVVPALFQGCLPVEVARFAAHQTRERVLNEPKIGLSAMLESATLRPAKKTVSDVGVEDEEALAVTDNGNYTLDLNFKPAVAAGMSAAERADLYRSVHAHLKAIPGVLETGLFLDLKPVVVIARQEGIETLQTPAAVPPSIK